MIACLAAMPLVSVIMVFHRDLPFLRPAIASVLRQTWSHLELVLVDNGIALPAEALGEVAHDPRVRWVRRPCNDGIPAGHNAGVAAARGEIIALLDYDDLALPQRIERQVEALQRHPQAGLVSSHADTIDASGRVVGVEFSLSDSTAQHAYVAYAAPVVTPAYAGRREVFERFPYRAEFSHAADFDFLSRAIDTYPAVAVPEVLLQYRRYPEQTTRAQAALIEAQRGAIRLLTARRRAGRPEEFAAIVARLGQAGSPGEHTLRWAGWALDERLCALAAYLSRRALAQPGNVSGRVRAFAVAWEAIRRAGAAERRLAGRIFLLGPVRALRLRPDRVTPRGPPVATAVASAR